MADPGQRGADADGRRARSPARSSTRPNRRRRRRSAVAGSSGSVSARSAGWSAGWARAVTSLGLVALPWAFTPAGAGALVGSRARVLASLPPGRPSGGILGAAMASPHGRPSWSCPSPAARARPRGTVVASAPLELPVTDHRRRGARSSSGRPASRDAEDIARVRIASWRAAYRGIVPDAVLDGLDLAAEAATWRDRLRRPGRRQGERGRPSSSRRHRRAWSATSPRGRRAVDDEAGLGEIWAIYVDPAAQGRGVGRALMEAAVRGLAVRGFGEAVLWVFERTSRPAPSTSASAGRRTARPRGERYGPRLLRAPRLGARRRREGVPDRRRRADRAALPAPAGLTGSGPRPLVAAAWGATLEALLNRHGGRSPECRMHPAFPLHRRNRRPGVRKDAACPPVRPRRSGQRHEVTEIDIPKP